MELDKFENIFRNKVIEIFDVCAHYDPAHDSSHVFRVVRNAKQICEIEKGKIEVVIPAAYFHDFVNIPKNHPDRKNASTISAQEAVLFLKRLNYPEEYLNEISHAISAHSFSAKIKPQTIEAQIVQDADRLDAIGAIGLGRCFQVSGSLNRKIYSSTDPFGSEREINDSEYTLDHFYKKLLLIKEQMHTVTGHLLASQRHLFLEHFLKQLETEIIHQKLPVN